MKIEIEFNTEINGYIVTMPDFVTLDMLKEWREQMNHSLQDVHPTRLFSILIDSGAHHFESVACLKFLRDYLTEISFVYKKFTKGAFIAPRQFVEPHIKSSNEAYFNDFKTAFQWLSKSRV